MLSFTGFLRVGVFTFGAGARNIAVRRRTDSFLSPFAISLRFSLKGIFVHFSVW